MSRNLLPLAILLASCGTSDECEQSADCADSEVGAGVCLDHLERAETYCTTECTPPQQAVDDPCPVGRGCALTDPIAADGLPTGVCIERILECVERERCGNGLDDNCDGQTDEADCSPFVCFTDGMCGEPRVSACTLGEGTRECASMTMTRNVGSPCESNDDCYNRHCAEGYCAPACSFDNSACPDSYGCVSTDLGVNACLLLCFGNDICSQRGGTCSTLEICNPADPALCDSRSVCVR